MHIKLREQWDIQQNYKPKEIKIRESEVICIREFNTPDFVFIGIALSPVET